MNISLKKISVGISAGINRILLAAVLVFCCNVPLTFTASAVENNEIRLYADGSEAVLELYFPQAAAEETASVQVSVCVKADSDGANLEFIPDSGLSSKIVESRYRKDTGVLNIYLAGRNALFPSSGSITVGRIRISSSTDSAVSATVSAVKNSVKFVIGGELVSPENDTDYPSAVNISAAGNSASGTWEPAYPDYSSGNYFPNIPVPAVDINNGGDERSSESGDPFFDTDEMPYYGDGEEYEAAEDPYGEEWSAAAENPNPPDTSMLLEAISGAESFNKADYTESSYNALREAVNKAKSVISDPNATQDEIDEALLDIENAIGMLQLKNDIPSGAEGYDQSGGAGADGAVSGVNEGAFGENNGNGHNTNEAQTAQNINGVSSDGDVRPADNEAVSQNEDGGNKNILWIIIASAAALTASAAIILHKRAGIKKAADGEHFNTK